MKRCPKCRRGYYDDSLLYCLDDGSALLEGPSGESASTAFLEERSIQSSLVETPTRLYDAERATVRQPQATIEGRRHRSRSIVWLASVGVVIVLAGGGYFAYRSFDTRKAAVSLSSAKIT